MIMSIELGMSVVLSISIGRHKMLGDTNKCESNCSGGIHQHLPGVSAGQTIPQWVQ